ncbi:MAG: RND transporter [Gammaproteobacteria bacterium]
MKWLDKIPLSLLLPLAVVMALAPFVPEPHLWEKLKMLSSGALVRPIDMFDLFLHGTPLLLLALKLLSGLSRKRV